MSEKEPLIDSAKLTAMNMPDAPASPAKKPEINANLKYIALFLLVAQNAGLALFTRYATTRSGEIFISSTAVVMAEIMKMTACLLVTFFEEGKNFGLWLQHLKVIFVTNFADTLKVGVPAFIYMVQNNLNYVAIGNLPAATYQLSYQLKILTTAIFSVTMLGKEISKRQWAALLLLFGGIAIVQINNTAGSEKNINQEQSQTLGMIAVLSACLCSGFAGVYFEKILKGSKVSLWTRNIQLGLFGFLTGLMGSYYKDGSRIAEHGFFVGYTPVVWITISINAFGGLLVAVVIKYADNILKGFACSAAIVLASVISVFVFEFHITGMFVVGGSMVMAAVYIYSLPKK